MDLDDVFLQAAGKTAIHRTGPSRPVRVLHEMKLLKGRILDFGSGHGADVRWMQDQGLEATGYDPVHGPYDQPKGRFATVLCTYVLNTLPVDKESWLIEDLFRFKRKNGCIYVTVRRDIDQGGWTKKGTFQRQVELHAPIVFTSPAFIIYRIVSNW